MGVLQDQIAAIDANGALSEQEKVRQIRAVKTNGLRAHIAFVDGNGARYLGKAVTFGGIRFTVHSVGATSTEPLCLTIDMTRVRVSDGFTERDRYYIENPPILDRTRTENLLQVVGEMLASFPFKEG